MCWPCEEKIHFCAEGIFRSLKVSGLSVLLNKPFLLIQGPKLVETDKLVQTINEYMFDLHECMNNFSRLKTQIIDAKTIMDGQMDSLYKFAMTYEIKGNDIYDKILSEVKKNNKI